MAQNWKFDPTKRDYVLVNGSPVPTDSVDEAAYFILKIPRGKWIYGDPNQGSELHLFNNAKRTEDTEQLFAARVNDALNAQLVAQGRAVAVATENVQQTRQGTSNQTTIQALPPSSNQPLKFSPM